MSIEFKGDRCSACHHMKRVRVVVRRTPEMPNYLVGEFDCDVEKYRTDYSDGSIRRAWCGGCGIMYHPDSIVWGKKPFP